VLTAKHAIDAINQRFGRHPGYRALHAKGMICRASFTATPRAARLTRADHMQGQVVEATVRLSNGSGNPQSPDYANDVRGLATTFHLPGGSRTDILCQTAPVFPTRTPEGFIEFLRASTPGWALVWRLPLFLVRHPGALRALRALRIAARPPASYATCAYYAIHAFKWIARDGTVRYVRYRWVPEAAVVSLSGWEAKRRGADYLRREIVERLPGRPVRFMLVLQVAADGDPVNDPTAVWPAERETLWAGTLEITNLEDERETGSNVLLFDPMRLTDGIEPTDDPVLRFRPPVYEVSVEQRIAGLEAGAGEARS
jgi:catalase